MIISPEVFHNTSNQLVLLRLSGKAIRTLIIDMSQFMKVSEEILRYAFHELNGIEQLTLKATKDTVPFKYIAYLIEKNKDSLTKLCIDLPIEESSLKYFATLILNLSKIKHLHLTSNSRLDTYFGS
jgi:hypothetical protein